MKTILAFGDSITWGSSPDVPGTRHARPDRWPNALAAALGEGYEVITDGMRGRTTVFPTDMVDGDRCAAHTLPTALFSHAPLDLVILMVGTNDLQVINCGKAVGAMMGIRRLVEIVQTHASRLLGVPAPRVLVVAPPRLCATPHGFFSALYEGAVEESAKMPALYAEVAVEMGVRFFDAGTVAQASPLDGVHLDAANTRALGIALAPVVRALLAG